MKRLLTLVAFFATLQASAQQVNPVPDYVFANRMSAGRNTVTDTAAYFSIGPRYGATRGMMPPMVVDTASFSGNRRNGLLIFSVQKNKFLYWDSVGVKWAEMAGTAGTALTSADTAALLSTRAWRQKGIDSLAAIRIGGTGTINYLPKFTGTTTIGNSRLFDNGTNIGVNTAIPKYFIHINQASNNHIQYDARYKLILESDTAVYLGISAKNNTYGGFRILDSTKAKAAFDFYNTLNLLDIFSDGVTAFRQGTTEALRIFANARIGFNTTTDAGYQVDVNGTFRTTNGANFATSSGNVGIGTASPTSYFGYTTLALNSNTNGSVLDFMISGSVVGQLFNDASNFYIDSKSTAPILFRTNNTERIRVKSDGEVLLGTSSDAGAFLLQVNGNALVSGNIRTAAPSGGTANNWRLGEVATVSPTSPNRTIRVEIGGTVYYIHAKTTND